jgi:hypothetical protein
MEAMEGMEGMVLADKWVDLVAKVAMPEMAAAAMAAPSLGLPAH